MKVKKISRIERFALLLCGTSWQRRETKLIKHTFVIVNKTRRNPTMSIHEEKKLREPKSKEYEFREGIVTQTGKSGCLIDQSNPSLSKPDSELIAR